MFKVGVKYYQSQPCVCVCSFSVWPPQIWNTLLDETTEINDSIYTAPKNAYLKFLIFFVYLDAKANCRPANQQ